MNHRTSTPTHAIGHGPFSRPVALGRREVAVLLMVAAGCAAVLALAAAHPRSAGVSGSIFDRTAGPHVAVSALPGVELGPLTQLPGLSAASGPFKGLDTSIAYRGREAGIHLEGRPSGLSAVDRPLLVAGAWARGRGVVVERGFAQRMGLRPGDRVRVRTTAGSASLTVAGVAVTTAPRRNRLSPAAVGYVRPALLPSIVPNRRTYGSTVMLRLADPKRTGEFARWIESRYPGAQVSVEKPARR
jgi:putative ABC transport system permease protein